MTRGGWGGYLTFLWTQKWNKKHKTVVKWCEGLWSDEATSFALEFESSPSALTPWWQIMSQHQTMCYVRDHVCVQYAPLHNQCLLGQHASDTLGWRDINSYSTCSSDTLIDCGPTERPRRTLHLTHNNTSTLEEFGLNAHLAKIGSGCHTRL